MRTLVETTFVPLALAVDGLGIWIYVPGHQAVPARLPETGPVLLAIDAIADASLRDPETRCFHPFDADAAGVWASTRKLVRKNRPFAA